MALEMMDVVLAACFSICLCCVIYYFQAWRRFRPSSATQQQPSPTKDRGLRTNSLLANDEARAAQRRRIVSMHSVENYKEMFYQLHHIEEHQEALQPAERLLQSLLLQTSEIAKKDGSKSNIMHLSEFTAETLSAYMLDMENSVQDEYTAYMQNRRAGQSRDLFQTKDEAAQWLKDLSPVKLVDGAWLGNLRVTTTPFELQPVLRIAWQVLSEELGDGVLDQNHVHVFQNLIRSVISDFPAAETREFIECHPDVGNAAAWRSALAQLTISLFPDRYVPEILGFNMNFELVTLETLKASTELKEIGLDPLYFLLHICIDNSDVGHTAMALQTVIKYMDYIHQTEGPEAAHIAWQRVQAGFCLSQYVGQISDEQASRHNFITTPSNSTSLQSQVIEIFRKKTQPARSVHCASSVRFKGLTIEEWLTPERWGYPEWQFKFMQALSDSKPWIIKGNRNRSRLMRELNWGGKMFGAFTAEECETIGRWIDSLEPEDVLDHTTVLSDAPVQNSTTETDSPICCDGKKPTPERLLPLWFTSAGLLEGFCAIPAHTTSHYMMHILSTLRSQSGLGDTTYGAACHDEELPRASAQSLSNLGQEMIERAGLPKASSVYNVLETMPAEFGWTMMNLARSTARNGDYLVGMALAFANLHEIMATSNLLCTASQTALLAMAKSEISHLEQCRSLIRDDRERTSRFDRGYWYARHQIELAF